MKRIIDIDTWKRKDNFIFFSKFLNPCISITSEVDCTEARKKAKNESKSFFLFYLYSILRAANEIDELRCRIKRDGQVVIYDTVNVLTPIQINEDGKFSTVRIPWNKDFDIFYDTASRIIKNVETDKNPYAYTEERDVLDDENYNVILVSATPDLYFTSVTHTQEHKNGSDFPLLNAGKAIIREGKLMMPVAIYIHHGLVDGKHIADFFKKVERFLI